MDKLISIVIPVLNEEKNIRLLYDAINEVFKSLRPYDYEIIFVDDGSLDSSFSVINEFAESNHKVKGLSLKRNYGQTAAIVAGVQNASGELIVTMDGDLQNDPKNIPDLIKKLNEGFDMVSGWRVKRRDSFLKRRLPSWIANLLISKFTGLKLHDYGCTLKIYKKEALNKINLYGEMHRFIPVYIYWMGGKVTEIKVNHMPRKYGASKYGIERIQKVLLDLITIKFLLGNYSTSPLYFFGKSSFLLMGLGILCGIITLVQKFIGGFWVHRNPLILLAIFFFIIGTQLIFIGLLAELNMRIYYETTRKSIYIIDRKINC